MAGRSVRRLLVNRGSFATTSDRRADEARRRLRREGFVPVRPDGRIAPILEPGEAVLDVTRNARLMRRCEQAGEADVGDLYLTTRRLIHLAARCAEIELDRIHEAAVANGSLLLDLGGGVAVRIAVEQPGVLRVKIAAVRAARRQHRRSGSKPYPAPR